MKNSNSNYSREYVYLDNARGFILFEYNLEFNEAQVREFANRTNLTTITIGTRIAFLKQEFINKFPAYVSEKSKIEVEKKRNRASGGVDYNMRIDSIFAGILEFAKYGLIDINQFLRYLKRAAPDHYKNWVTNRRFVATRFLRILF